MKITEELLRNALADIDVYATIEGFQLGDQEYVTLVSFQDADGAALYLVALALRLHEHYSPEYIRSAFFSGLEMRRGPGTWIVRLRNWELVKQPC